jgi:hypothetical protein
MLLIRGRFIREERELHERCGVPPSSWRGVWQPEHQPPVLRAQLEQG